MGERGPAPKRSDQRRRRNAPTGPVTKLGGREVVVTEAPPADAAWHPVVKRWFEALASSRHAVFYEPSDYATAAVVAEAMSRDLAAGQVRGASLSAFLRACTALLATEGDRRRAGVELALAQPALDDDEVTSLDEYRRQLGAG